MNHEIEINAYTFVNKRGIKSVPRTITVDDRSYSFIDSGLQYLIQTGQHLVRLFDMTDGQQLFRLRLEDNQWTLVNRKALS
ncbi:MAG TPA: hypothetical protein VLF39_00695 [Candidatus Saccharimonadales bacterium]|nr:hypothetical protein [Candidatus Saccharimonadales bacterium]